eukprot:comp22057_c0_seq4/m.50973 comp22057_c0_seq4/g.50973  ORF comp22057_c0_seq4/g.50973 comp22057_c0_seq4/m.50973 type:complete len:410 (-) comp22057_c0_seq4:318-1547(-)
MQLGSRIWRRQRSWAQRMHSGCCSGCSRCQLHMGEPNSIDGLGVAGVVHCDANLHNQAGSKHCSDAVCTWLGVELAGQWADRKHQLHTVCDGQQCAWGVCNTGCDMHDGPEQQLHACVADIGLHCGACAGVQSVCDRVHNDDALGCADGVVYGNHTRVARNSRVPAGAADGARSECCACDLHGTRRGEQDHIHGDNQQSNSPSCREHDLVLRGHGRVCEADMDGARKWRNGDLGLCSVAKRHHDRHCAGACASVHRCGAACVSDNIHIQCDCAQSGGRWTARILWVDRNRISGADPREQHSCIWRTCWGNRRDDYWRLFRIRPQQHCSSQACWCKCGRQQHLVCECDASCRQVAQTAIWEHSRCQWIDRGDILCGRRNIGGARRSIHNPVACSARCARTAVRAAVNRRD